MDIGGTFCINGKEIDIEGNTAEHFDVFVDLDDGKVSFKMLPCERDGKAGVFPAALLFGNSKGKRLVLIIDHKQGRQIMEKLKDFIAAEDIVERIGKRTFGVDVI